MANAPYARFWKCALQVNPWSYAQQYQGQGVAHGLSEDEYNSAIADRCVKNEVQVVGIADHGSVEGIEKLRAALEAKGVVVLAGFEIASTEKVHMVCLYPAGTAVGVLNQYLGALGLQVGGKNTDPSKFGCLAIADAVEKQGGFWYAAHVTGASGLLRLQQDGGGLHHIWRECAKVLAAQIPADIDAVAEHEAQKILRNKNADYKRERPIALLNSKDVRKPEDLDHARSCSWVKMTEPSLDALRLACQDPESRVRLSHEVNPTYYSRIERVVVKRGYLEDLELDLSPNLNAVVGGRGTGKSTLIEAIRYALQLVPTDKSAQRTHEGIIEANFAKEKAGIEITLTSFQQNSGRYVISRYHGEPAKVLDEQGKVLQLTPKDILPKAEVYGQNELLAIVQDDEAKAKLLSRFLPDDSGVKQKLAVTRMALRKNRLDIDTLESKVADIVEKLGQVPALHDKEKSFQKLGLDDELKQVKAREVQRAYTDAVRETLDSIASSTDEFKTSLEETDEPAVPSEASAGALDGFTKALTAARTAALKAAADAEDVLTKARAGYDAARTEFDKQISAAEQVFNKAVDKLPTLKGKPVATLAKEYQKVSGELSKLQPLGAQKIANEAKLLALSGERANLLQELAEARNGRWTDLSKAVKKLNKRLEGQLCIDFEPERVRAPLKEFLLKCSLDGIADKRLAWIDDADSVVVAELVNLIKQGPDALLGKFKKAGMQKQVAEALAALPHSKVRELEELELPERMELLLNVSRDSENYRAVGKLSTGQQCTAILHLLLLDNPDPLIIDQPEDNLDNAFIAEHIVNELRASKTKRQYIFATHNANIPVFGDAEWIGVLQEEEARSKLLASGSIDAKQVKDLAASILEGGREAFNRRREKYGL